MASMVDIATIHLEGDAIQWYNWLEHTQGVPTSVKGLCWHCEEQWSRGHEVEPRPQLLLIEPADDSEQEEDLEHEVENTEEELQLADCMVYALAGYMNPQMTKIGGFLKQQPIIVVVDIGSTNNFMNNKVVARITLQIEGCSWFDIKVADGCILKCE
ncbi:hypothetical protein B296_00051770 [Ensete ventricosum]|uniref:Uncharacterized protein n=1 Tax=Ensete ventricosum TaxID=4639 RepID=A0A426XQC4_ENSVE|nr:hypothetical protein B296_00051770 [Ensete ventricosum]